MPRRSAMVKVSVRLTARGSETAQAVGMVRPSRLIDRMLMLILPVSVRVSSPGVASLLAIEPSTNPSWASLIPKVTGNR